jgi:hypothetical protein
MKSSRRLRLASLQLRFQRAAIGTCRSPAQHKRTYQRLANQLRKLEAKGSSKAVSKLSHKLTKPAQMYRTRLAAIANA